MSTNWMNLEAYVCFTVIEWTLIQFERESMAFTLAFQSLVWQEFIMSLKSSISLGSTGLDTEGWRFLKA